ncbi:hypothetical protein [Candidatus Dactylopiibacterium carminicum]|uniref:hypothetical protein n=1 Tax=Candidatus Dactylopiibacterium carminicum TaxID=857335 RepID=UPI003B967C69
MLTRLDRCHARAPEDHAILLELLQDVIVTWQAQGIPFWVLLTDEHIALPRLHVPT